MANIGFLGLGAMGRRMAANFLSAGHSVTVWNRTAAACADLVSAGATLADTPREAASGAEIVISMLTDDAASRAVWMGENGAMEGLEAGSLAVEASTLSLDWISTLGRALGGQGVAFLDAPVAGSRPQAEAKELIFLVGGSDADVTRFEPIAKATAKAVLHAGPRGKGAALKLMVNGLLAVQTAALSEIFEFAAGAGIDAVRAAELLAPVPVTSPAAAFVANQIAAGAHDPMFTIDLMEKDLGYLTANGAAPLLSETRARFAGASARGHGGKHISAVGLT
ncbi:MAG: NAD(P)-dependent oxidoreductase [Pseudomonadota bacterium]